MTRIGPCILLLVLNVLMIQDFNVSMRRRKKLLAGSLVATTSTLFPVEESFSSGGNNGAKAKLASNRGELCETIH